MKCEYVECNNEVIITTKKSKRFCCDNCRIKQYYFLNPSKKIEYYRNSSRTQIASRKAANRKYVTKNPEYHKERYKKWRLKNPNYRKEYYKLNKERELKRMKEWVKKHPEYNPKKDKHYLREWHKKHPGYQKKYQEKVTDAIVRGILKKDGIVNPSQEIIEERRTQLLIRREIRKLTNKIKSYEKQRNTAHLI